MTFFIHKRLLFSFSSTDLVSTKTTIPIMFGEQRKDFTSTLRVSRYSPLFTNPTTPRGIVELIFYTCWCCSKWSVSDGKVGLA